MPEHLRSFKTRSIFSTLILITSKEVTSQRKPVILIKITSLIRIFNMVDGIQLKKDKLLGRVAIKKEKNQITIVLTLEMRLTSIKVKKTIKEINHI